MIARKLKPEERYFSGLHMAVAFEGGFDLEKARATAPEAEETEHSDCWAAFVEGEPAPVASFIMNKYQSRFDGHVVKMGGVGGVATLPAHRRGGAIRACMQASFRDLYNSGFVLSSLYPFSSAYYRKFGFENGQPCQLWTLPLSDLNVPDVGGRVYQLFPGDDYAPLLAVYNAVYEDCNLSVVRKVYDEDLAEKNLLEEKRYIFVWEDETGAPGAFLIGGRDGEVLNCRTDFSARNGLLFRDARALQGLLHFVRTAFIANFEAIRFSTPAHTNVISLFPEVTSIDCKLFVNGMLRVVNVEEALKLCRCRGEGKLTVQVNDPLLPENCGAFRIEFTPNAENKVHRVTEQPDVVLNIGDFSALLLGVRGAEEFPWMPAVQVKNQNAPFENVFYKKPCHVLDLF